MTRTRDVLLLGTLTGVALLLGHVVLFRVLSMVLTLVVRLNDVEVGQSGWIAWAGLFNIAASVFGTAFFLSVMIFRLTSSGILRVGVIAAITATLLRLVAGHLWPFGIPGLTPGYSLDGSFMVDFAAGIVVFGFAMLIAIGLVGIIQDKPDGPDARQDEKRGFQPRSS